ncbi:cytochrome c [Aerophototrophica crusticola]|uniref:Cytochrome c n=1 Tax=Aerophototrophica crusticola TaxID=1709002 RepID=A0A858R6F6_9PROT|nr:cytochrome c [Rhodospirillaceae bacterium B3]
MTRRFGITTAGALLAAALVGTVGVAVAQDTAEVTIEQRKANFKQFGGAMKVLKGYAKDGEGTAADASKAAQTLVTVGAGLHTWFPAGTAVGVGKSEALPAIWTNMADFEAKNASFQAAAKKLAAVNFTDKAATGAAFGEVGGTCKACHDSYKKKD